MPITVLILSPEEPQLNSEGRLTQSAIIARVFAGRTCAVELYSTYTTDIILWHIPSPRGHRIPFFDGDFHDVLLTDAVPRVQRGTAKL